MDFFVQFALRSVSAAQRFRYSAALITNALELYATISTGQAIMPDVGAKVTRFSV
jgi:hypothetical protein